jgi:hypothetical protein
MRRGLRRRIPEAVPRCASLTVVALLVLAAVFALSSWTVEGLRWSTWLAWVVVLACVAYGLRRLARAGLDSSLFAWLLAALVVLARLAWVIPVGSLPVYDYERYHVAALALLHGSAHGTPVQDFGIVTWLVGLASVFGSGLLASKVANVVLAALTAFLLLALGRRLFGEAAGRAAGLLFALWPADIAFRGVLATEFGFVVGWLSASIVLLRAGAGRGSTAMRFATAGALLGLANWFRPTGVLIFIVAAIWVVVRAPRGCRPHAASRILSLAGGFTVALAVQFAAGTVMGFDPRGSWLALNILSGTNTATQGQHGDEDGALFDAWVSREGYGHALAAAIRTGWGRIVSRPLDFAALAVAKYRVMWGNDGYGVYWSTEDVGDGPGGAWASAHQDDLLVVSQFYYLGLLTAAIVGAWMVARRWFVREADILLLAFPAFAIVHVLLEVQSRYHYPLGHVVLLLAGMGLVSARQPGPDLRGSHA